MESFYYDQPIYEPLYRECPMYCEMRCKLGYCPDNCTVVQLHKDDMPISGDELPF